MFSSAEFVEEWNQIFSFKMKESDLTKPTETFVFSSLIHYLKMFNFDTAPMIQMRNSENSSERRSFLVRFCNYIDHIYKISDKSHCFLYYDLQHPAPKKTVHMLNHLLNYLFYYNMFKESIVPLAYGKVRQREELVDRINKYKYENEQIEIKAKMIEKRIVDYRAMIPKLSSELNELITTEAQEKENIAALEEQLNNYNSLLESLRNQEMHLTLQIVSQEEVDRLLTNRNSLTDAIAEQEGIESNTYAKNQEHSATVVKLQNIMTSIDTAMNLNPPSSLAAHKDCNAMHKDLEAELTNISCKKESLMQIHAKLQEDIKTIEKAVSSKHELLKEMKVAGEKNIERFKLLVESNDASIRDLAPELQSLERQLEEERDVSDYIVESAASLVKATMDNCLETKTNDFL